MLENDHETSARISLKPDIAHFRLIWDVVREQYRDMDLDHRLRVYEITMNAVYTIAMSEGSIHVRGVRMDQGQKEEAQVVMLTRCCIRKETCCQHP